MKTLMRWHRVLSCFVAPAMVFFAVSGAWQAFRLQQSTKDGSYQAPAALELLSQAHMAEKLSPEGKLFFRLSQLTLASIFVLTAVLGLVMAHRITRPAWKVWVWGGAGALRPVLLYWVARAG
jgi:hypothetical protein